MQAPKQFFFVFKKSLFLTLNLLFITLSISSINSCSSGKLSSDQKKEQAELYYSMGTNALIAQNYSVALSNLLKSYDLDPKRSDVNNNLGMAYHFKNKNDLAFKHINRAIELDSKNSDAQSNLASLYISEKKYDKAKEIYNKVLQNLTYDKQYLTYYNLGKIEFDQKNFSVAKEFFKQSVKENPNACASHFYLGMIEYRTSNWNSAAEAFKEAYYGTCYTNEYPLFYHAKALEQKGDLQQAAFKYQELIDRFSASTLKIKAQDALSLLMTKMPANLSSMTAAKLKSLNNQNGVKNSSKNSKNVTTTKVMEKALYNRNSEPNNPNNDAMVKNDEVDPQGVQENDPSTSPQF